MTHTIQSPSAVVMVRPHHFNPNPQTAADNVFQKTANTSLENIKMMAFAEVNQAVRILREHGVDVHVFDDTDTQTPDSVFPNNWFSTHANGRVGVYPMYCENRRKEVNTAIVDFLAEKYIINHLIDYSDYAQQGLYLEGTGAMVLDHENQLAYAVRSKRMSEAVLQKFCHDFNYHAVVFNASDEKNVPVYHTNVLMCVASKFAMISLEMIKNQAEKCKVIAYLEKSNKEVIDLTIEQIKQFAGNALELSTPNGNILVLSQTAYQALTEKQIAQLSQYVSIVPINVTTIELAGGSIRCMLAGIHLAKKD